MDNFRFVSGDTYWEDHGGTWAARTGDHTYICVRVVPLSSWDNPTTVSVDIVEVDLSVDYTDAMRSCGHEDGMDDWGDPLPILAHVDACISFGAFAPIGPSWIGTNAEDLRKRAMKRAYRMVANGEIGEALKRPVNALGWTAAEYRAGGADWFKELTRK